MKGENKKINKLRGERFIKILYQQGESVNAGDVTLRLEIITF